MKKLIALRITENEEKVINDFCKSIRKNLGINASKTDVIRFAINSMMLNHLNFMCWKHEDDKE